MKINWDKEFPTVDFIIGNPPFVGKKEQKDKKDELLEVFKGVNGAGVLDYVTCWYLKAAQYMKSYPSVKTGFVSTNSISQGEQVAVLWNEILNNYEMQILFAHQTFKWTNEASGIAAVHCIIVGFAPNTEVWKKAIYEYEDISGEPQQTNVKNINPYLVQGKNVFIGKRAKPIHQIPEMNYGSMPIDEGFLILTDLEKNQLIYNEPLSANFIKQYTGGDEFINNKLRWCLWLEGVDWKIIKKMPLVLSKIKEVETFRKKSNRPQTIKLAETPHLFGEIRQPKSNYLLIPNSVRKFLNSKIKENKHCRIA